MIKGIVIAGSHIQYLTFLAANNLSAREYIYCTSEGDLYGIGHNPIQVIRTGTYWTNRMNDNFMVALLETDYLFHCGSDTNPINIQPKIRYAKM